MPQDFGPPVGERPRHGLGARCLNCGSHVTEQFARVLGDNDDDVYACPGCSGFKELSNGAGSGPGGVGGPE